MASKIVAIGLLTLLAFSNESFAASCQNTYVSNAKMAQMIDQDLGEGASQYCRINTHVGGSGDYIFAVVECRFPNGQYVQRTVRGRGNMFDIGPDKCRVYLQ